MQPGAQAIPFIGHSQGERRICGERSSANELVQMATHPRVGGYILFEMTSTRSWDAGRGEQLYPWDGMKRWWNVWGETVIVHPHEAFSYVTVLLHKFILVPLRKRHSSLHVNFRH